MKIISKTIKDQQIPLFALAIIGILATVTLVLPAALANAAKPVAHFATPGGISLSVSVAKKHISLDENTQQVITSKVTDEFGNPIPKVGLNMVVTTPKNPDFIFAQTGLDGVSHVNEVLTSFGIGDYSAAITATNPHTGGSPAHGSVSWAVSK